MKNIKINSNKLSRRGFLNTTAVLAASTLIPTLNSCGSSKLIGMSNEKSVLIPNSKYAGVQIGAITYSFRDLKGGLVETIKACSDAGISSVELMGTGVEDYLGAPDSKKVSELKEWRKSHGTPEKYAQLRKTFNDAGINIHIYKWVAGNTEEELDYSFKVAKALGAIGISAELDESNARLMGPVAAQNGMYAILHNHYQYAETNFNVDKLLAYSPANMLNFDIGHYFGSTGLNPTDFILNYHDRIASIHLKDKTGKNNISQENKNQVWGQGETPISEVLFLIRDKKWPIYCDIELEYPVVPWSSSVKEVRICKEYCRQILI
ncbi:MAG: sugar phosphate isomerase/epimerase [Dysgonamonadaceae bacterium]|nr:sugar phosphate isomerase/epimerase [Dysgonamonadaceae bacterium]MDD3309860.1 sugar phosphate isomerase/epimerase [Dysgonamonadaceae bacterium]MDD3899856.1 sugar phosphate isomerase/epimerase [Dysgonamonadaceae bacterium]MDD4398554.1 sugar phosphate isomerase/epimerase [Dysgonamonadaceae bacterium]MEA5080901.1 sugar phosphate isomerase/epimerase [Dysgonamonadaceae bacterium]